jgi:excisionase family DNA binding protein
METLLDKKQLADLLRVSVKTIDLWLSRNIGPKPYRIGRLVRFKQMDVEAFINQLSTEEK